jgi:ribosomal protein S18 acetylase RimI-like enzyme
MLTPVMETVELRPATDDDVETLAAIQDAEDIAWWGAPDGDVDDMRTELEQVRFAHGSLEVATRIAMVAGRPAGSVLLSGRGRADMATDPSHGAQVVAEVRRRLVAWAVDAGATTMESLAQDQGRLATLAEFGFHPSRSSFELERSADVSDLGPTSWPAGIAPATFRPAVDDEEVHEMIYSVWLDVEGHTYRPLEEWRTLFLADPSFDPDLAIVARRDDGIGPVAGFAVGRVFTGTVGWVSQVAVGRPDRGVGLGRALLVEAFTRLAARDVEILGLGVEAANATALGLYRSVGLDVTREFVHCTRA